MVLHELERQQIGELIKLLVKVDRPNNRIYLKNLDISYTIEPNYVDRTITLAIRDYEK